MVAAISSAVAVALLAGSAAAYPRTPLLFTRQAYSAPGLATFNDYAAQTGTVCGPMAGSGGTYGAAASDISPDISGGLCDASLDMSKCSGKQAAPGYQGPSCPKTNCGKCYKVTNQGAVGGGSVGGVGNSVIVQIIDSCPSKSADNYCKTDVPANERCGDSGTNQLDIDQSAYQALTGTPFGSGPNLQISIAPSDCAAGSSTGGGDKGSPPGSSTAPADPAATLPPSSGTQGNGQGNGQGAGQENAPSTSTSTPPAAAVPTPDPAVQIKQANDPQPTTQPAPQTPPPSGGGGSGTAALYAQCGGIDNSNNGPWSGPTTCAAPNTCQQQNQYYSQCLPPKAKMAIKRDAIAIENSTPFFEGEAPLQKREAVIVEDGKPFFASQ